MKFSFFGGLNETLAGRGAAKGAAYIRELGFAGIEFYPGPGLETMDEARALKRAMDNEGLAPACFSVCCDLVGPKAAEEEESLKLFLEMAVELGAPYLHHTIAPGGEAALPGTPMFERLLAEAVERAGRVADNAAKAGVRCLYEDQGFVFNGPDAIDIFLKALNRPNVGVCADFGNVLVIDGEPGEFLRRNAGRIFNVHVKDLLFKPAGSPDPGEGWHRTRAGAFIRHTVPGHGAIDIVECLKILLASGYDGWYAFEFGGPEVFDWGIRTAVENMTRYYEMAVAATGA